MNIINSKLARLFYKKCCFCGKRFEDMGNSTWPIYPEPGAAPSPRKNLRNLVHNFLGALL